MTSWTFFLKSFNLTRLLLLFGWFDALKSKLIVMYLMDRRNYIGNQFFVVNWQNYSYRWIGSKRNEVRCFRLEWNRMSFRKKASILESATIYIINELLCSINSNYFHLYLVIYLFSSFVNLSYYLYSRIKIIIQTLIMNESQFFLSFFHFVNQFLHSDKFMFTLLGSILMKTVSFFCQIRFCLFPLYWKAREDGISFFK